MNASAPAPVTFSVTFSGTFSVTFSTTSGLRRPRC